MVCHLGEKRLVAVLQVDETTKWNFDSVLRGPHQIWSSRSYRHEARAFTSIEATTGI